MPTASKLVGAVLFAALAYYVSEQVKLGLPEGMAANLLSPINALIGLIMGWRLVGGRAGEGFVPATGYGLTTVFATTFWGLLIWSAYEMIRRAWRGRYDDPFEALFAMADLGLSYSTLIVTPPVVGSAVIGSFVLAMIVEFVSHRWS
jgi:hypothetical protein